MHKRIHLFGLLIGVLFVWNQVKAQRYLSFDARSIFLSESILLTNATAIKSTSELQVGNISLPGPFNNIRQFYLIASGKLGVNKQHGIGATLLRLERGELISETAAKVLYSYEVSLNEKNKLLFGTHVGFYQVGVLGNSATGGVNDIALNLDISLGLKLNKLKTGIAWLNVTEPQLQLIQERIKYLQVVDFYGSYPLIDQLKWQSEATVIGSVGGEVSAFAISFLQTYATHFQFAFNIGNRNLAFWGGVKELDISFSDLKILLGYQFPITTDIASSYTPLQLHLALTPKAK